MNTKRITDISHTHLDEAIKRLKADHTYSAYAALANVLEKISPEELAWPALRVAILRNFTLDSIIPVMKGEIALAGYYPQVYLSGYDQIVQDILIEQSPLYTFQPDFIILAIWLENLAPNLVTRFISLSANQVSEEINRVLLTIEEMLSSIRSFCGVPIIMNNFPLPVHPTLGILDYQSENYQTYATLRLNNEILRGAKQYKDVYIIDYMSLLARVGLSQAIDDRYWHIGKAPLSRHSLVPIGQEYGKFIRALRGKTYKCLVLDCDNTLWGGIIGEDGLNGIQIGADYPGSCYQAFQREILNLHDRGVILALCSKNNEQDVIEVLRDHPDMVLREEHFATWQINWDDKVTNLMRIAESLNIGLDSMVFVDDSQFECDLVREKLPQMAVLQLSSEPSDFARQLSSSGFFDSLSFSNEDRERNRMYRQESQRKQLIASAGSLDEYLKNLEMIAEIGKASELTIPRVSQLTQKTNQFNLTTKRYSEGDIRAFVEDHNADVFYLKLRDRISDLGIIGVAILKYNEDQATIDSFLMSCRAIGRGAEDALLSHILENARARGCKRVIGQYRVTKKNSLAADFYKRCGFKLISESIEGSDWEYIIDNNSNYPSPEWIKLYITQ